MTEISLKAHAKINLSLKVIRRRPDGYHDIRSLMQGIDLFDVIRITKCPENGTKYNLPHCTIDGVVVYLCVDINTIPTDMNNLAFKGIKAVLDACSTKTGCEQAEASGFGKIPEELMVCIDKRLPVAAGIAGGSGNAAACMLGLNAMLGSVFSLRELMEMGAGVGADVPFSIMMNARLNAGTLAGGEEGLQSLRGLEEASAAAVVSGIGDIVEPTAPISRHVIMANPGISVSTRDAYEALDAGLEGKTEAGEEEEMFINDFEEYTLKEYPEAERLNVLMHRELEAEAVAMSGSGPTMAAYYEDREAAERDFCRIRQICRDNRDWRVWLTETGKD